MSRLVAAHLAMFMALATANSDLRESCRRAKRLASICPQCKGEFYTQKRFCSLECNGKFHEQEAA